MKEITVKDLTQKQKEAFEKAFYWIASFDDRDSNNSSPWGCVWDYNENYILTGETIEDMAKNYILTEKIEEIVDKLNKEFSEL